ncbi:hypothetical protein DL93DRAFT_2227203 [Clavulina sp. PMI_390]|nr:hypothetical protein DL93DRAFT_2227203 [Clavulina sp. PMI_390]
MIQRPTVFASLVLGHCSVLFCSLALVFVSVDIWYPALTYLRVLRINHPSVMPPTRRLSSKDLQLLQTKVQPSGKTIEELAIQMTRYSQVSNTGARVMRSDPTRARLLLETIKDPNTKPQSIRIIEHVHAYNYTRDQLRTKIAQMDRYLESDPVTFEDHFLQNFVATQATILVNEYWVLRPLKNMPSKLSAWRKRYTELNRLLPKDTPADSFAYTKDLELPISASDDQSPTSLLDEALCSYHLAAALDSPNVDLSGDETTQLLLTTPTIGSSQALLPSEMKKASGSPGTSSPRSPKPAKKEGVSQRPKEDQKPSHFTDPSPPLLTREQAAQLSNDPLKLASLILLSPEHITSDDDNSELEQGKWRLASLNFPGAGAEKAMYEIEFMAMPGCLVPIHNKAELIDNLMASYIFGGETSA